MNLVVEKRMRWRSGAEARALAIVTGALVAFGIVTLFSASSAAAVVRGKPGYGLLLTQSSGILLGSVAFMVAARVDADWWRRLAWPVMITGIVLMLIPVMPGLNAFSAKLGGSNRSLVGGSIQPSEIAKFAVVVWTAMLIDRKKGAIRGFKKGVLPFVLVVGTLSILAKMEPDFSVAVMFGVLMITLMFIGNMRIAHIALLILVALPLVAYQASRNGYVRDRVASFFADEERLDSERPGVSEQQRMALIAVGSGQLLGVGYGEGNQQRGRLALAYNDFIGSVIGEEFGFIGIAGVTLAFTLYGWLGFRIADRARTPFMALLAIGLTFTTVLTAFVHLAVVIGLLPNTGLTLPFISFGRSNLVLTLAMTGILVNIGSEREHVLQNRATDPRIPIAG